MGGVVKTTISLAKALKLKNRLAGRMSNAETLIQQYNTVLVEQKGQVDVPDLIKTRDEIMDQLVVLKTAIIQANTPIQEYIIRKGELSSRIEWIRKLNTTDGVLRHGYQNTEMQYVATLKKQDVEHQVRLMEKEIDSIQDHIDEYNATKKIEIDQRALDLAS